MDRLSPMDATFLLGESRETSTTAPRSTSPSYRTPIRLDFGIVACRETVPRVQRLIDDLQAALEELEQAAGL